MKPEKRARLAAELADANRRVVELESQLASRIATADSALAAIRETSFMASAVILRLTALGGREVVPPVAIRDGLSPETVAAIRADLARSYQLATLAKPKGV